MAERERFEIAELNLDGVWPVLERFVRTATALYNAAVAILRIRWRRMHPNETWRVCTRILMQDLRDIVAGRWRQHSIRSQIEWMIASVQDWMYNSERPQWTRFAGRLFPRIEREWRAFRNMVEFHDIRLKEIYGEQLE